MLFLPYEVPWKQTKPPFGTRVNPNHPLAEGLFAAWINNEGTVSTFYDVAAGLNGVFAHNATPNTNTAMDRSIVPGIYGPALKRNLNNAADGLVLSPVIAVSSPFTFCTWVQVTDVSAAYQNLFTQGSSTGFWAKSGHLNWYNSGDHLSATAVAAGSWVFWGATVNATVNQFYLNGMPDGQFTSFAGINASGMLCDLNASEQFLGLWSHSYYWNRALSAAEMEQLNDEPFCFFEPDVYFIPIVPAAGGIIHTQTLTGTLSFTGSQTHAVSKGLTGNLSFTGSLAKTANKVLTGTLSFAGSVSRIIGKSLTGGLSFAGGIKRGLGKGLSATLSFTGTTSKNLSRALTGSLSFTGSFFKTAGKALGGTLSFSGGIGRSIMKQLAASISPAGILNRGVSKLLTASLSFIGVLRNGASSLLLKLRRWFEDDV